MTDSALWWTYLAVVFVHQLPDLSYVSFLIKFFAKNFLYKWDLKFKASSDLICTLIWPQTASKCDTPSLQKLKFKIKFFRHVSIFWISPLWMHFLTRGQWWQRAWEWANILQCFQYPFVGIFKGFRLSEDNSLRSVMSDTKTSSWGTLRLCLGLPEHSYLKKLKCKKV